MKKLLLVALMLVCVVGLSGCPTTGKTVVGSWQLKQAVDVPQIEHEKATDLELANLNRLSKDLVFGDDGTFTYTEKRFVVTKTAEELKDATLGWVTYYVMTGTYKTDNYVASSDDKRFDTVLQLDVTSYQEVYDQEVDKNGNVTYLLDTYKRPEGESWFVQAQVGIGPFDELLVNWSSYYGMGKAWSGVDGDNNFNRELLATESYVKIAG